MSASRRPPASCRKLGHLSQAHLVRHAQVFVDTPKPAPDEADNDVDIPEQGLSLTQHNYQFNVLVGIDPAQVEEMVQEGRTMLEQAKV